MMNDKLQNIISTIQKLRALSLSSNPNEAQNAATAAAKLIDEYQLEEADLEVKGDIQGEQIIYDQNPIFKTGRILLWQTRLATVLANHYGCVPLVSQVIDESQKKGYATGLKLVGRPSDIEIVRYFYSWLQPLIVGLTKVYAHGKGHIYAANFSLGIVDGIENQLINERELQKAQANSTGHSQAMVLLSSRLEETKRFMTKTFGQTKRQVSYARQDLTARGAGRSLGEEISLSKGLKGSVATKRFAV